MIIVSDTTALSTLYLIGELDWLKALFGQVLIPRAVYDELQELRSVGYDDMKVFEEADWLVVKTVQDQSMVQNLLVDLDLGESEAIALAIETKTDYLLIDERKGSRYANQLGVPTIGLLRVVLELKDRTLITEVKPVLDDMRQKGGSWLSEALYRRVLQAAGE